MSDTDTEVDSKPDTEDVTAPARAMSAAAAVLMKSLHRGDWDALDDDDEDGLEEFADAAAVAAGRFEAAAQTAENGERSADLVTATLPTEHLDEIFGVLGSDILADTVLKPLLQAP